MNGHILLNQLETNLADRYFLTPHFSNLPQSRAFAFSLAWSTIAKKYNMIRKKRRNTWRNKKVRPQISPSTPVYLSNVMFAFHQVVGDRGGGGTVPHYCLECMLTTVRVSLLLRGLNYRDRPNVAYILPFF